MGTFLERASSNSITDWPPKAQRGWSVQAGGQRPVLGMEMGFQQGSTFIGVKVKYHVAAWVALQKMWLSYREEQATGHDHGVRCPAVPRPVFELGGLRSEALKPKELFSFESHSGCK